MHLPNTKLIYPLLFSIIIALTGCGGGGGGGDGGGSAGVTFNGNTAPAAIDATNAEAIGESAGEIVQKAAASTDLPSGITITNSIDMDQINSIVLSTVNALNLPAGAVITGICSSGSITIPDGNPPSSGPVDYTFTYNNCVSGGITFNGTVAFHYNDINDPNAGFSLTYTNFSVVDPTSGTFTINMTVVCTSSFNCTYNSDFVGSDGGTHRISISTISGNASIGFDGSATFYNATYGEVTITISSITYGSCGTFPNGGNIIFNSSNGSSGTIVFNGDCTVSGTWNDGTGDPGGSGSF